MCDIMVCRICLQSDTKFYNLDQFNLKIFYEKLNGLPVAYKDGLPHYFCFECAALLHKFHKFREKSVFSQKALREMISSGTITHKSVKDFLSKNLSALKYNSLQILVKNGNVKTCQFKMESLNEDNEKQCPVKEEEVIIDCYNDYYSDDDVKFEDPATDPVAEESDPPTEPISDSDIVKAFNRKTTQPKPTQQPENETKMSKLETKRNLHSRCEIEVSDDTEIIEVFDLKTNQHEYTKHPKKVTVNTRKSKSETKRTCSKKEKKIYANDKPVSSKSKKKAHIVPPETKKYKFKSRDGKLKGLAFLNSGFWKKTSLSEECAINEFQARGLDKKYLSAAFKCTDCFRGFSQKSMLDRHMPLRHGEAAGPLHCRFCKMRFKLPYYLNKHMRQHFIKYECLRCNLVCNLENSALFHEEYHNGVIRKCTHCYKEFRHLSTFYSHLRTHRSKHMCALCGESFVSPLGLRLHKKAKHAVGTENQEIGVESSFCEICQIKFESKEAYDKHLMHSAMHTEEIKFLDDTITRDLLGDNDEGDENDQKSEPLIKRKSRVENTLSAVRKYLPRKTTAKKPTTCHQCGKHFGTQSACMKHHLTEHPGTSFFSPKERIICEICGASLAPGSVAAHLNQHTRQKMYTCDTCGRSFTTSTMLRNHLVTHTGEKKYLCSLCDKRFTQNGSLSLHYRTFHLKQPYPKRNRRKKNDNPDVGIFNGKEE